MRSGSGSRPVDRGPHNVPPSSASPTSSVFRLSSLDTRGRTKTYPSHRKKTIGVMLTRHYFELWRIAFFFVIFALPARAHVGSPDVFLDANAGPYRLFVTVRVPQVIPGIAQIEIRSASNDVREIKIAPMQLTGPGSQYAPTPDVAERSQTDPQSFTGSLWLMELGSLQVRVDVDGAKGRGELAVPVPAVAQRTLPMQKPLGTLLFGLMILLASALVSISAAAVREGDVAPGVTAPSAKVQRARIATVIAAIVVGAILLIGGEWWKSDATQFARRVYTPPQLDAILQPDGHLVLHQEPIRFAAGNPRRPADVINFDNIILDHGHLMHFFMIRMPEMDSFWHLHPSASGSGTFIEELPSIPPGHYDLFADVVLSSGFPITMIGKLDVPALEGRPLTGDDSGTLAKPISQDAKDSTVYSFPDGGSMVWEREAGLLKANASLSFTFHVEDKDGKAATDMEPYMGMAAHAEIVRSDASVFAHVHPAGSISMAALDLAQMQMPGAAQSSQQAGMSAMNMPGMSSTVDPTISFPYGFPKPGLYRVFVQIKRAGRIETAVFDASVN
jgi:hypothetical protein